jgi:cytochrome c oxidase assembly protein subunit 15
MILAAWLWLKEERRWLRWLGVIAFIAVCVQGVLGGLRVTLYKDELGIFHATLAQLFLLLVCAIAFFLTTRWRKLVETGPTIQFHRWFRPVTLCGTFLILGQLVLGATMRHQHAGLAVPDFPLAYGKLWPPTDLVALEEANRRRIDHRDFAPITAAHIYLHMAHRLGAVAILALVTACAILARKAQAPALRKFTGAWVVLILAQAALGAFTVWSNKAADIATAHVALGALSLVWGALLFIATAPIAVRARVEQAAAGAIPSRAPALSS